MLGNWLLLRATPPSNLSYQTFNLLSNQAEEDLLPQNLPREATRCEEFSLTVVRWFPSVYPSSSAKHVAASTEMQAIVSVKFSSRDSNNNLDVFRILYILSFISYSRPLLKTRMIKVEKVKNYHCFRLRYENAFHDRDLEHDLFNFFLKFFFKNFKKKFKKKICFSKLSKN